MAQLKKMHGQEGADSGHSDAERLLAQFNASECTYLEWISVGMALKREGYPLAMWAQWSAADLARYHVGECERKWRGFSSVGESGREEITGATLAKIAKDHGATLTTIAADFSYDWDDYIIAREATGDMIVDKAYVDSVPKVFGRIEGHHPGEEAAEYLRALFDSEDIVAFTVTAFVGEDGKFHPYGCSCAQTAGELLELLATCGDDIGEVFGDPSPADAGMWMCLNPTDGQGRQNANITKFNYTLVECDTTSPDMQLALYSALNLPCAAIVYSGGKSMHAIVHVDAKDANEYRTRVERIYKECAQAGIDLDPQNKNASRLSRMPGAMRGEAYQELIATNTGAESYEGWLEWLAQERDDLPPDTNVAEIDSEITLPAIVVGTDETPMIRLGDKIILTGDSKGHKTMTAIDLAIAVATGTCWLRTPCNEGQVFYVDFETTRAHFLKRVQSIWADRVAHGANDDGRDHEKLIHNFRLLCLKGHSEPLKVLLPKLVRRIVRQDGQTSASLIVIDPIYKVMGGDESDMRAVSEFTNVLDSLVTFTGAALLYLHHHTKGASGGKKALDRSSGSGVFGRDADAAFDITELYIPEQDRKEMGLGFENDAVRMEIVLRYSRPCAPLDLIFKWPRFYVADALSDYALKGADPLQEANDLRKAHANERHEYIIEMLRGAVRKCREEKLPTTRANVLAVLQRNGARRLDGGPIDRRAIQNWTQPKTAPWCPIRCDPKTYELYDEGAAWYES